MPKVDPELLRGLARDMDRMIKGEGEGGGSIYSPIFKYDPLLKKDAERLRDDAAQIFKEVTGEAALQPTDVRE